MSTLGERVRRFRLARAMTQDELAEATEGRATRHTVTQIESGRRGSPRPGTVKALADALGVDPEDLTDPGEEILPKGEAPISSQARELVEEATGTPYLAMTDKEAREEQARIKTPQDVRDYLAATRREAEFIREAHKAALLMDGELAGELERMGGKNYLEWFKDLKRIERELEREFGGEHAGEARLVSAAF